MPSTQWCESICLLTGIPRRNWCRNSFTDTCASAAPSTCSAILRTSQPSQSVGHDHSASDKEPTSEAKRSNSVSASSFASGRWIRATFTCVSLLSGVSDVNPSTASAMAEPELQDGRYELDDHVATIPSARPERLNAFRAATLREFIAALDRADA